MKPGRELDKLIAELIMGWDLHGPIGGPNTPTGSASIPKYSTEIEAAWQVIEKIPWNWTKDTEHVGFALQRSYGSWIAGYADRDGKWELAELGRTPAHAICLAALKFYALSHR